MWYSNDTLICLQVVQTMNWMWVTQMISINYHEVKHYSTH